MDLIRRRSSEILNSCRVCVKKNLMDLIRRRSSEILKCNIMILSRTFVSASPFKSASSGASSGASAPLSRPNRIMATIAHKCAPRPPRWPRTADRLICRSSDNKQKFHQWSVVALPSRRRHRPIPPGSGRTDVARQQQGIFRPFAASLSHVTTLPRSTTQIRNKNGFYCYVISSLVRTGPRHYHWVAPFAAAF